MRLLVPLVLALACSDGPGPPQSRLPTIWLRPQAGGSAAIRPAVGDGVAYLATGDGHVVARDAASGAEVWRLQIASGAPDGENMELASGILVVPVARHVSGIDVATRREVWQYRPPLDTTNAGPNPAPGFLGRTRIATDGASVFIPAWGASVSALDVATGAVRWTWQPGPTASDTAASGMFRSGAQGVAVAGDTVYVWAWHYLDAAGVRSEPWLVALDRGSGRELWRYVIPSFSGGVLIWSGPVVHDRFVIAKSASGDMWAIDRFTRQLAWKFAPAIKHAAVTGPVLRDGVVYLDSGDDYISAVRASDGQVLWRRMTSNAGAAENLLATAYRVYVPGGGNGLAVIDRRTGRLVAEADQPDRTWDSHVATPVAEIAPGRLIVGVKDAAWAFKEP